MRSSSCAALILLAAQVCRAENQSSVALDTSETLFTVLTAINTCGYDQELGNSDPLRARVRSAVARVRQEFPEAQDATVTMCEFYAAHQPPDASKALAQAISLALYLNPAPNLTAKAKDADIPPDAAGLLGILPLLQNFYQKAQLHRIWEENAAAYSALTEPYHRPLAKMLFDTEIYLKLPSSTRLGQAFTVFVDPLGAPGQTNARNYGSDYYVVISPGPGASLKMDQIRHTYLHYLLDPLAMKYPTSMKRLEPLLASAKTAPMDESFKNDVALMATECFIRAIEVRITAGNKAPEAERQKAIDDSEAQGFILTQYFYDTLVRFEKDPTGLRSAYGDLINGIDVRKEQKRASQISFASTSAPELLHLSRPLEGKLLITAEQRLSAGDAPAAQKLAQQALDEKSEDPGRALFILAEVATRNSNIQEARDYFERALQVAQEPKVLAWSHIYLGRIFDLQENREAALDHYRAAATAGSTLPEAKAAAEMGMRQPYEPPRRPQ